MSFLALGWKVCFPEIQLHARSALEQCRGKDVVPYILSSSQEEELNDELNVPPETRLRRRVHAFMFTIF